MVQCHHILRNFFLLKLPCLDNMVCMFLKLFLLSLSDLAKFGLSPLVDACQPTYLSNLKKEKHWLACSPSNYSWGFSCNFRWWFWLLRFPRIIITYEFYWC
jgi:hypothetical protein